MKEMININRKEFENARRDFFKEIEVYPIEEMRWDELENTTSMHNELYQQIKEQVSGIFTLNEASLIVSAFNGCDYTQQLDDRFVLKVQIEDAIEYEQLDTYYEVNKDKLLAKIKTLTEYQCFAVIVMIVEFWCTSSNDSDNDIKRIFGLC